MSAASPDEALLDEAMGRAFTENAKFAAWFLSRTPFCGENAKCDFCRYNNPWEKVIIQSLDGTYIETIKERETDILIVYCTPSGRRLGIHIENKLADGSFTKSQPESYQARKNQWKNKPKLGNYDDAIAVLVAPQAFLKRCHTGAALFDARISHEDVASVLPSFAACYGA